MTARISRSRWKDVIRLCFRGGWANYLAPGAMLALGALPAFGQALPTATGSAGNGGRLVASAHALALLDATSLPEWTEVRSAGFRAADDGGQGLFALDKSEALGPNAADGGVILPAKGNDLWYWRRIREGNAVNLLWYGARRDGLEDCAPLVRRAQQVGDVYYPNGTYLQSHVDVRSNRRYFGDGPGRTIIRRAAAGGHDRIIFGVATTDFEGSGRTISDVKNVRIEDLTLDFNLVNGWVNRPLIQFRGDDDHHIRDVTIQRVEFIDSARVPHPGVLGKSGGDAWCINVTAPNVERFTVRDCVSLAESHQFIAGGGSIRGVRYLNNEIHAGWANGISLTAVGAPAKFEDVEISGNRFYATSVASIYIGYDFGHKRPIGPMDMRDIRIRDNLFVQDPTTVYGLRPVPPRFPCAIQVIAGYSGVQNLTITGNTMRVPSTYDGGDINFLKLARGDFELRPTVMAAPFVQPEFGRAVQVRIKQGIHAGKPWAYDGCIVAIGGGGYYRVTAVDETLMTLESMSWLGRSRPGVVIAAGRTVTNLGGAWSQVLVNGNNSDQRYLLNDSVFEDLSITNNVIKGPLRMQSCSVEALKVSGNTQLTFDAVDCNLAGTISDNTLLPTPTFGFGAIGLHVSRDGQTGFDEACNVVVAGNTLISSQNVSPNDVGVRIDGDARHHGVYLWNNVFSRSSALGLAGNLASANHGMLESGNEFGGRASKPVPSPPGDGKFVSGEADFVFGKDGDRNLSAAVSIPDLPAESHLRITKVDGPGGDSLRFAVRAVRKGVVEVIAEPKGSRLPTGTHRFLVHFQVL